MKKLLYLFVCLMLLFSCTRLQYRYSDDEIQAAFAKAQIPTTISYFEVDSLNLKVRTQSVTQGSSTVNLVFLHGSPSSLSAWNGYLKDSVLHAKVPMYAIDRPGYGYSNFGDAMPSIREQAVIINAVLNDKDLDNIIAIGSSYGGPLVARMAVNNPKIKGVIMISPAIDPENEQRIWQSDFTQFWGTRWMVPTGYRVAGDEKTVHAKELSSLEEDWPKVLIPVMHIHGDLDELVPYKNVKYSERVFSNIEIITIPNTGHEIAWSRPELIKPYIFNMIKKIEE